MAFNVKSEIMASIAKTDDPNMKTLLLLMLGVLEEIGDKIDTIMRDEKGLRDTVLNGHEPVHHDHHVWIARKIKEETEDANEDKASKRKIRDGLLERILWSALVAFIGGSWLIKEWMHK